jgi:hypothetical protein
MLREPTEDVQPILVGAATETLREKARNAIDI